jgi:hypothetical protein
MRCRRALAGLLVLQLATGVLTAQQTEQQPQEREYPAAALAVKTALQQLGAYQGAKLPTLDGFIRLERVSAGPFERPYYEFKIELVTVSPEKTLVRVKAHVSAWYTDPQGTNSGYQAFESNGRLEGDLLDRLADYLQKKGAPVVDPGTLAQQLEAVRKQREVAARRVAELEQHPAASAPAEPNSPEFFTVSKPQAVLSAPDEHASVLLRAQVEDAFEIQERRGEWLRVALEGSQSGWINSPEAASVGFSGPTPTLPPVPVPSESFSVIREMASTFTGDWAPLNGKQALYVWARPEGSPLNVMADKKLRFAESIFKQRFHASDPASANPVAGVVVIFLDQAGGVAAASMEDIALWTHGSLSQSAFVKKCSLDPPSAFAAKPSRN